MNSPFIPIFMAPGPAVSFSIACVFTVLFSTWKKEASNTIFRNIFLKAAPSKKKKKANKKKSLVLMIYYFRWRNNRLPRKVTTMFIIQWLNVSTNTVNKTCFQIYFLLLRGVHKDCVLYKSTVLNVSNLMIISASYCWEKKFYIKTFPAETNVIKIKSRPWLVLLSG